MLRISTLIGAQRNDELVPTGAEGAMGKPVYEGLGEAIEMEGVNPHLYGKSQVKPHRKMGHITVTGDSMEEVQNKLLKLQSSVRVTGTE